MSHLTESSLGTGGGSPEEALSGKAVKVDLISLRCSQGAGL